jgi:hypothetical protein
MFLDVIKIDTTFPLIRAESGQKFESVLMKKTESMIGNETNAIFFLLQHSRFDLEDLLGSYSSVLPSSHCIFYAVQ